MDEEKEDLGKIEPGLNNILDNNEKISDEFRDIARACFGRIFYMLGEKNFKRWIDRRQINSQLKELVIESMPKEDMENHPSWVGYYTRGTNKIKLSTKLSKDFVKDTNTHETFHLMTDNGNGFCTFLDEGLTEYMKGMAINQPYSYANNCNFVMYIHNTLGDSIIKAYLTDQTSIFDKQMLELINYDNTSSMSDIKNFYKNLDLYHNFEIAKTEKMAFMQNGASPKIIDRATKRLDNAQNQYESVESEILSMCQKIVVGKILEMTKNMAFYKIGENGLELDLNGASIAINDAIKKLNIQSFFVDKSQKKIVEWEKQTGILAAEQVLENTHILMEHTGQERENRKKELIEKMLPTLKVTESRTAKGFITQTVTIPPSIKNEDITIEENTNIPSKMFEKFLTDDMNITQYIETFARIAQVTGLGQNELENYLNKYNIKYFGNIKNFRNVNDSIFAILPKIKKLNDLQEDRKRNTISSEYKSIGNNRFIEKRDNQIFFVELDENGGFSEREIKYSNQVIFLKDGTRLEVDYQHGIQNLEVMLNNKKIELGQTLSLQDIKDIELTKSFSKDIRENIQENRYTTILNDEENPYQISGLVYSADIDKRTRKIDFNKYISDLKNVMPLIPEKQREKFVQEATESLLDRTYRIERIEQNGKKARDSKTQEAYSSIITTISGIVADNKITKYDSAILLNSSKTLNTIRSNMVEKNSHTAAIFFKNQKSANVYSIVQGQKAKQQNDRKMKDIVTGFKYSDFYKQEGDIPLDDLPYHLSGVYATQPIDDRNVLFAYNEFANAIKDSLSSCPTSIREETFNKIFEVQMKRTYLISETDLDNENLSNALTDAQLMIKDNVFSDIPIKDEKMKAILGILNDFKVGKAKQNQKVAAVQFKDKHAKDMFDTFSELISILKKSGVRDSMIEEEVKSIIDSQLKHDTEKSDDNEVHK